MQKTRLLLLTAAASLATALFLVPGALATEPNDDWSTATPIPPGVNGPYDIDPAGDADWYTFTVAELSSVRLETGGLSGDSVMYLYDANLSYIDYDDDSGSSLWSLITQMLDPGVYYVDVEALSSSSTFYNYTLTLAVDPPFPLAEGFNGPFNVNATVAANWFRFDVVETSTAELLLNGTSGDPQMYLYDVNFSYIDYDDDGGPGL